MRVERGLVSKRFTEQILQGCIDNQDGVVLQPDFHKVVIFEDGFHAARHNGHSYRMHVDTIQMHLADCCPCAG